ncbi:AIR synthase related protein [Nocardia vinacea]|uniref:thiamine-phosphate kinase n=1 Tax=Nocardia vinacea TaxID=96468 RepID=UPI0033CECA6E
MALPDSLDKLGEYALHGEIARILNNGSSTRVVGDDAAVLTIPDASDTRLLVSTDRLASGVAPELRARLLVTQTLSDIICMGGYPLGMLLAIQVPRDSDPAMVLSLVESINWNCQQYGCSLVGGDTKEGDIFSAVGVGFGTARADKIVRRTRVEPGDLIGVTLASGAKWGKRWANHLVNHFSLDLAPDIRQTLADSDQEFNLPVAESRMLIDRSLAVAGLDLSDGIGSSLRILAEANGIGFDLSSNSLDEIIDQAVAPVASALGIHTRSFALTPGYMWNNMYAVRSTDADAARTCAQAAGGDFIIIAEATDKAGELLYDGSANGALAAASDEKFRAWAWSDRTEWWLSNVRSI